MPGLEDQIFSGNRDTRRLRILNIYRNRDVDPNMGPNGVYEEGRLERLVDNPNISFDDIRRAAQRTQHNGFTIQQLRQDARFNPTLPYSDPTGAIDQSFSYTGEQEFGDGAYTDQPSNLISFPEDQPVSLDEVDPSVQQDMAGELAYTDDQGNPLTPEQSLSPEAGLGTDVTIPEETEEVEPEQQTTPPSTTPPSTPPSNVGGGQVG